MPLSLTNCLESKYKQEADYEIFTGKTFCRKRASIQKIKEQMCVSAKKMHKRIFYKNNRKGYFLK